MPSLPLWRVGPPLAGSGGGPLSNLTAVESDTVVAAAGTPTDTPEPGDLVRVRGQQSVVSALDRNQQPVDELAAASQGRSLVTLTSVSDDDLGDELTVAWEIEPGREVLPSSRLPEVTVGGLDDPNRLGAFLDAVRWGTVASADTRTLQAPFRSGIVIKDYQLVPVARELATPRVNLLVADDVGLGKTVEAGLIVQEMLLRHRARRVVVVCPASLTGKWRAEMADRFGLAFDVLDAARLKALRRSHGPEANPLRRAAPHRHQPPVAPLPPHPAAARRGRRRRRAEPGGVLRPADRRRGPPLRPARPVPRQGLRRRQQADPGGPPAGRARRAPAVPLRDPPQRLPRVLAGAAGDARPRPVPARRRARSRRPGTGDGPPTD